MDEVFLWGTGFIANANKELFLNARAFRVKILGFIDNDIKKAGINFLGFPTYSREILYERHYNNIVICSDVYFNSIKSDILMDSQIKNVKVYSIEEFFYPKLLTKIRASIKSNDPEKDQKLQALQDASFDVYFPNLPRKISRDLVYFDDGMPYINFEGKRMYYPMGSFHEGGEEKFIWDILREQVENSPHEYICKKWKDDLYVPHGVVIDAGVCEGNFALRYIESIDHLYIVESDPKWIKPLQMTFSPWKDKVTFIFKYLSDNTDDNSITIDDFIQENHVDFLKMDIEGFEKKALEGASNTIKRGISKCTVCTYHRRNHQSDIERIFSKNNYATWFSNGYMFFRYDPEEYIDFELRKGVIYAEFQKG